MSLKLTGRAEGFLGRRYVVHTADGEQIVIRFGGFSRTTRFDVHGEAWRVRSKAWRGGAVLERERDGHSPARAEPRGWFSFTYDFRLSDRHLELVSRGFWGRRFELVHGARTVGTLRIAGFLGREIEAELPDGLPLPVRVFIVLMLVLVQRRRAAAAAAAS